MLASSLVCLPWQQLLWDNLWRAHQQQKLPHALLFTGNGGLGKMLFAKAFAKTLLCTAPSAQGQSCGHCRQCHFVAANTHPDLKIIAPEEGSHTIKIDQIREVVHFVSQSAQQGGYRIIIVNPAAAMNTNAANALLKTLEEPTAQTLLILIAEESARLPATIISRCQRAMFNKPGLDTSVTWLRAQLGDKPELDVPLLVVLADGAPLKALQLAQGEALQQRADFYRDLQQLSQAGADPIRVATQWQDKEMRWLLEMLVSWAMDIMRYQLMGDAALLTNRDYKKILTSLSQAIAQTDLLEFIDLIQHARQALLEQLNLNRQLVWEELLITWAELASKKLKIS